MGETQIDEPDDEGPCNDKELELNMYCRVKEKYRF